MKNVHEVLKWLELNGCEYWTVSRDKSNNTKVFEWYRDETLAQRRERFIDTMKLLPATWYYVQAKKAENQTVGFFSAEFTNGEPEGSKQQSTPGATVISGVPETDVQRRIDEAIERYETRAKLAQLERERAELAAQVNELNNVGTRFMKKLEPYIGQIAGSLMNKFIPQAPAVGIAGTVSNDVIFDPVEDEEQAQVQEHDQETRIATALQRWSDADADFIDVLEFIANFAASGEKIDAGFIKLDYSTVKSMLLKK